jgi:hypothetical protein
VIVELACDRLVGGMHNGVGLPLRQPSGGRVDQCRRLLDIAIGATDRLWQPIVADREMDEAPLGLRPPVAVAVGRQLDLVHRVSLSPHPGPANTDREIVQFRMGSLRSCRDSLRMAEYAALFLPPRMLDGTVGCCFGSFSRPPIANERLVLGLVNVPPDEGFHIGCAVHASKTSLATRAAI